MWCRCGAGPRILGRDMEEQTDPPPHVLHLLEPGEAVAFALETSDAELHVTERRLIVSSGVHVRLNAWHDDLRLIQFDLEALRPATMVIVPHRSSDEPQMMSIGRADIRRAADLLAFIGERLA